MPQQNLPRAGLPPIPPPVKAAFWVYFNQYQDVTVLSLYHGFIKVKLGQLRPVFETIFGAQ